MGVWLWLDSGFGSVGWCYVCVFVSLDYLCICQVQVSVYCAKRIPVHLRCTQCSNMLHLVEYVSYRIFVCGRYRKTRLICV